MSLYFESLNSLSQALSLPPKEKQNISFSTVINNHEGFENSTPIPFNLETAKLVQHTVMSNMHLHISSQTKYPSCEMNHFLKGEIHRFIIALKTYYLSPNPVMPLRILLDGILEGPKFIKTLKRCRVKSFVKSMSEDAAFLEPDPDMDNNMFYTNIVDIGDIFNYRYWFFWDQPDEGDFKASLLPLNTVKQEHLDLLYDKVMSILPDGSIDVIQEEEILLEVSSSSGLESNDVHSSTRKVFDLKQTQNYFDSSKGINGKMSYIQKCPGDTRDSITLPVPQSNVIKLIEKQVSCIAAEVPFSAYVKDPELLKQKISEFDEKFSWFICRDLKKDGLTKVRVLVQTVLQAIKDKYPNLPACKYFDIYKSFTFLRTFEGVEKVYSPNRGVGLGMSSAITTILQSAIFSITIDEMYSREDIYIHGEIGALFYHDDAAIGFENYDDSLVYDSIEDEVMNWYGQIKAKSKSFAGPSFVLCERYSDYSMNEKTSMQLYMAYLPMTAINIAHAKDLFLQSYKYIDHIDWKEALKDLVDRWGYEFYPDEVNYPYSMGGWLPSYYLGVDVVFATYDTFTNKQLKAMYASRLFNVPLYDKSVDKPYFSPVQKMFYDLDYGPSPESYFVNKSIKDMRAKFRRLDNPGRKTEFWRYQLKKRRSTYDEATPYLLTTYEIYQEYFKLHKNIDILPPKDSVLFEEIDKYEEVEEIYKPSNPYMQYLKFHNPMKLSDKIMPWPCPPDITVDKRIHLTSEERRKSLKIYELLHPDKGHILFLSPIIRLIQSDRYYNPNAVVAACHAFYGCEKLPLGLTRDVLKPIRSYSPKLFRYLHIKRLKYFIEDIIAIIGYRNIKDINIDEFIYDLQKILEVKALIEFRKKRQQIMSSYQQLNASNASTEESGELIDSEGLSIANWSDSPLEDNEYFIWLGNPKPYKHWRYRYFESIRDKSDNVGIIRSNLTPHQQWDPENMVPQNIRFDEVEEHIWKESGGTMELPGIPLTMQDSLDAPEADAVIDFYENNSDSDSSAVYNPFGE
jgi:hypothetical protein